LRPAEPDGGYVRTCAAGTAELRTHDRGGLCRYIIREEGEALLVGSAPESRRYAWGHVVGWGGLLLVVVTIVLGYFGRSSPAWIQVSLLIFVLGLSSMGFVASAMQGCPDAKPPPGERWKRIGGPDH